MPPSAAPAPSSAALRRVRRSLLAWYAAEHRDFPWRRTSDPYEVLVSEVMLQQTQASRVVERFPRFLDRFPTIQSLAGASDAEVLVAWSGLGYNRRALALRDAARQVAATGWPAEVAALERLPGVGAYTARALASLAFGLPVGVVDTNVRRWLTRRFGPQLDLEEREPARLQELADRLARPAPREEPPSIPAWTHATMEFGARICSSRAPRCEACPIARGCPSRGRAVHVPVARQPAFTGSLRAVRGAILRQLAAAPDHQLPISALLLAPAEGLSVERAVDALLAEALIHLHEGYVTLGGANS